MLWVVSVGLLGYDFIPLWLEGCMGQGEALEALLGSCLKGFWLFHRHMPSRGESREFGQGVVRDFQNMVICLDRWLGVGLPQAAFSLLYC